jgi:hypothetical protein
MSVENNSSLVQKEQKLISTIVRVLASICIFVSSLIVFLLVPIFPPSISLLLAVACGALCYKTPVLSIFLSFLGITLAFAYQLSLPISIVVCLAILLFIIAVMTRDAISVIHVSIGILAATLMITPLYFLAIPLLLAIPLFSSKGGSIGNTRAIATFIALYIPILIQNTEITSAIVILGRGEFTAKAVQNVMSVNAIFANIKESIPVSAADIGTYLDKFNLFFPTFRSSDLFGRFLGLLLVAFIGVATGVINASLALFHKLKKKRIALKILAWITPGTSLLVGIIVFLLLFITMAQPLQYTNGIKSAVVAGMIAISVAIGVITAMVEIWLRQRNLINELYDNRSRLISDVAKYLYLNPLILEPVIQDRINVAVSWIPGAEELFSKNKYDQAKEDYESIKNFLTNTQLLVANRRLANANKVDELLKTCISKIKRCTDAMVDGGKEDFSINRAHRLKNAAKYRQIIAESNNRDQSTDQSKQPELKKSKLQSFVHRSIRL